MYDINELLAKELFWIKEYGRDKLMYFNPVLGLVGTLHEIDLPRISIDYEEELKELGVPYEICDNWCIIHDPNVEEYHDITEPFMTISEGHPKRISASPVKHTGKIPTNNMLKAAESYRNKVWEDIKPLLLRDAQKRFDKFFERSSKNGLICCWKIDIVSVGIFSVSEIFSGKWGSKYYLIPLENKLHDYIVISKVAFKGQSRITLKVPERYVGQLIGHGGENSRKHAHALGVDRVNFEAES